MGRQIIKQPNGLYAVFSTIVDDFILVDATPQDIINDWTEESRKEIYEKVIKTIDALDNGEKPYFQFTMSFDEAIKTIEEIHGKKAESLKYFPKKTKEFNEV